MKIIVFLAVFLQINLGEDQFLLSIPPSFTVISVIVVLGQEEDEPCDEFLENVRVKRHNFTGQAQWTSWGSWAGCSATCGTAFRSRTRQCSVFGQCGGGITVS